MKKAMFLSMVFILALLVLQSCTLNNSKTLNNIDFQTVKYQTKGNDTIGVYGRLANSQFIDG
jgi:outer membrane biogenesis lipoprotein LolB